MTFMRANRADRQQSTRPSPRSRSTAVFDVYNLIFEFVIRIAALKIQYSSTKFSIFSIIYQRKPGKSVLMKKTSKSPSFLLMENAKKNKKRDPLFPASMLPEKSFPIGCVLKCHFLLGLTRPPSLCQDNAYLGTCVIITKNTIFKICIVIYRKFES